MIDDLVDIVHPMPTLHVGADENEELAFDAWSSDVEDERRKYEKDMRDNEENSESYFDPLLAEIGDARRAMLEAEERMRLLVAYGREFIRPAPYQLKDLAGATGMSISGTRGAYTVEEIATVARRLGRQPRSRANEIEGTA